MKETMSMTIPGNTFARLRSTVLGAAAAALLVPVLALADDDNANNSYIQTNLVSNLAGVAQVQDTNLVNAWGISFGASSPFWISDNGSGLSTLYAVTNDSAGNPHVAIQGLKVAIPGEGVPTGQIFNGTGAFNNDSFIFAGEDGTISGWRGALGSAAELLVNNTNAVYKGITLDTNMGAPLLILANFREGTVDIYGTNLDLVQLQDPNAPEGYAPFNVLDIGNGLVIVTFAKQDDAKHDDVAGRGHGFIDVLHLATGKFHRFASGSDAGGHLKDINSPWGIALAPKGFGEHGDHLLIGNFGSGTIMSFDADGDFNGLLKDTHHHPIAIDGLWALTFGNGGKGGAANELYFTAGPDGESNGLFGSLTPAPEKKNKD